MDTKKEKNKTTQIIEYLMDLIRSGKIPVNKIMPSEHQLMHKFDCSRNIVVGAYQRLSALGAVYSISKRGHFVAENFHNLIKPISFLFKATSETGVEKAVSELPQWMNEKHIIFPAGYRVFDKKYFNGDKLITEGEIFLSTKDIECDDEINMNKPIIDFLISKSLVTNVVYQLVFEKVEKFGMNPSLAIRFFGYDTESICIAGKFYIDPEYFEFYHQEFSLIG
ncbi:winged helix-turn-helix domain-containing protein [Mycoplasma hafezii]|uniref:winged helix-turn-helix domain-containing protein n=1 Tax=Mycoplasma hafezii TaxID=525886 RepID=UPI003CE9B564